MISLRVVTWGSRPVVSHSISHIHQRKCLLAILLKIIFIATFILNGVKIDIKHRLIQEGRNLAPQRTEVLRLSRLG